MNRTGDTEPSPPLVPLGDADAAVCTDGACEEAGRLGLSGVPFFVIDRRYGISGAQPAQTFGQALRTAYAAEDAPTAS